MSEDNAKKYFAPPWIKYPNAPKESAFWKDGSGAEYLLQYKENIDENEDYLSLFPKSLVYESDIEPDETLSKEAISFYENNLKDLLIKFWSEKGTPKYDIDYEDGEFIFMYDYLYTDESVHINMGTGHYHSLKDMVETFESVFKENNASDLWDELKYTIFLNLIYHKFVSDINYVNELIKTGDNPIVYKSDNLELGLQEENGKYIGKNLFGLAMMEVRDLIKEVYANYDLIDWQLSGGANSTIRCMCSHGM